MSKARDIANILSANTAIATDTEVTAAVSAAVSTHATAANGHVGRGTTANRPSSPSIGDIYFDTTLNALIGYRIAGWEKVSQDPAPEVASINPSSAPVAGTTVNIVGASFKTGPVVRFIGTDLVEREAQVVTYVSSTGISATTPNLPVAYEPYDVKVINNDGQFSILENCLDAGGNPNWNTASGNILTTSTNVSSLSTSVSATDPDGTQVIYSSTDLLPWMSLNSSTGSITGTFPSISSDTTYNFNVTASDGLNTSSRSFNVSRLLADGSSQARAAASGTAIRNLGITTDGIFWLNPTGSYAFQAYVINSRDGGGWVKALSYNNNTSMSTASSINENGAWIEAENNLAPGKLRTADITALQTTNSILMKANNGNASSPHRYWKYRVENGSTHYPRASRIGLMLAGTTTDQDIINFTTDNCSDSGSIPGTGTEYTYDFVTPKTVVGSYFYSVYNGGSRTGAAGIYYSDNGTTWTQWGTNFAVPNNSACGIQRVYGNGTAGDSLFAYGGGTGKLTYTSSLPAWGTDLDPTLNYTLSVDPHNNGTYSFYCTYSNDPQGRCTHGSGNFQWISDHNYTNVASAFPTGLGSPICWGFYPNYVGTNLHFMSGINSKQSDGEIKWGDSSTEAFSIYVK
jgi:hypothetical protein